MHKVFLLIFWATFFLSNAQQPKSLRDSILKYQHLNPNLAIQYGLEYIEYRADDPPDKEMVKVYSKIGGILLYMELYSSSLEYYNEAIRISEAVDQNENKTTNNPPAWIVLNIGNIYYLNRNFTKAKEKFLEAEALFKKQFSDPRNMQFGLNTCLSNIGLVYGAEGNYDKQEELLYKVLESRRSLGKTDDILYSMMELMSVKLSKGDLIAASDKLQEIIQFYEKEKVNHQNLQTSLFTRNYGYAFLTMGAYFQSKKKYDDAIENLNIAQELLKSFPVETNEIGSRLSECYLAKNQIDIAKQIALKNLKFKNLSDREKRLNFKVLEKIYKKERDSQKLLQIKDSLILISTGLNNSKIIKSLNDLETQILLSNSARALNESKIRYNTYIYILIIGTVILFFSLVTIRINYNFQKERGSRLELEKEKVLVELNQKNRELVSKTNFIIQRNDYLRNLKKKIENSQNEQNDSNLRITKELNRLINSEKSYEEFDKMFVSVYPDFYQKLNQITKLSQTDLRLASYIKMNRNNHEIANISGISLRTVESQRYRLTKKLNLDKNQDLNSYLISL